MIVDTNAVSAWAKGDAELLAALPPHDQLRIPVIAAGEYLWGLRRSRDRGVLEPWLVDMVAKVGLLTIEFATAEAYAVIREGLHRSGRPIPTNDAWIAALALQHGLPVLSRDAHFDLVDGIQRVAW